MPNVTDLPKGESPKMVFRLLPRKPIVAHEDPKHFLRRASAALRQQQAAAQQQQAPGAAPEH